MLALYANKVKDIFLPYIIVDEMWGIILEIKGLPSYFDITRYLDKILEIKSVPYIIYRDKGVMPVASARLSNNIEAMVNITGESRRVVRKLDHVQRTHLAAEHLHMATYGVAIWSKEKQECINRYEKITADLEEQGIYIKPVYFSGNYEMLMRLKNERVIYDIDNVYFKQGFNFTRIPKSITYAISESIEKSMGHKR